MFACSIHLYFYWNFRCTNLSAIKIGNTVTLNPLVTPDMVSPRLHPLAARRGARHAVPRRPAVPRARRRQRRTCEGAAQLLARRPLSQHGSPLPTGPRRKSTKHLWTVDWTMFVSYRCVVLHAVASWNLPISHAISFNCHVRTSSHLRSV